MKLKLYDAAKYPPPNLSESHLCAVLVCSWSGLIRKVSNTERRLALDFGSFVNAFCFTLPFSVTAFCSAWQKRCRLGLVAVLHVKL